MGRARQSIRGRFLMPAPRDFTTGIIPNNSLIANVRDYQSSFVRDRNPGFVNIISNFSYGCGFGQTFNGSNNARFSVQDYEFGLMTQPIPIGPDALVGGRRWFDADFPSADYVSTNGTTRAIGAGVIALSPPFFVPTQAINSTAGITSGNGKQNPILLNYLDAPITSPLGVYFIPEGVISPGWVFQSGASAFEQINDLIVPGLFQLFLTGSFAYYSNQQYCGGSITVYATSQGNKHLLGSIQGGAGIGPGQWGPNTSPFQFDSRATFGPLAKWSIRFEYQNLTGNFSQLLVQTQTGGFTGLPAYGTDWDYFTTGQGLQARWPNAGLPSFGNLGFGGGIQGTFIS